jgi:hypothetical protein
LFALLSHSLSRPMVLILVRNAERVQSTYPDITAKPWDSYVAVIVKLAKKKRMFRTYPCHSASMYYLPVFCMRDAFMIYSVCCLRLSKVIICVQHLPMTAYNFKPNGSVTELHVCLSNSVYLLTS